MSDVAFVIGVLGLAYVGISTMTESMERNMSKRHSDEKLNRIVNVISGERNMGKQDSVDYSVRVPTFEERHNKQMNERLEKAKKYDDLLRRVRELGEWVTTEAKEWDDSRDDMYPGSELWGQLTGNLEAFENMKLRLLSTFPELKESE